MWLLIRLCDDSRSAVAPRRRRGVRTALLLAVVTVCGACVDEPAPLTAVPFFPVLRLAEVRWRVVASDDAPLDSAAVTVRFPNDRGDFVTVPSALMTDTSGQLSSMLYQFREDTNRPQRPVDTISVWAIVSVSKSAYRVANSNLRDSSQLVVRLTAPMQLVPTTIVLRVRAP